jgi:hypothetical protein
MRLPSGATERPAYLDVVSGEDGAFPAPYLALL